MGFWKTCINFLVDFSLSNNKERCAFPWTGERVTRGRKKIKNVKGRGIATPLIMNKKHSCSWKIHTAFLMCTAILWLMTVVAYRHRTSCSTLSYRYCPSYLCIIISSQFVMHAGFNFYLNESVVMYNSLQVSSTTPSLSPNKRTETRTYFHCCINSFFHLDCNNFWECFYLFYVHFILKYSSTREVLH